MRRRLLVAFLALACAGPEPAPPAQRSSPAAEPVAQPSIPSLANQASDTDDATVPFAALGFCGGEDETMALRCSHVASTRHGDTLVLGVLHGAPATRENAGEEVLFRYSGRLSARDGTGYHVVAGHGGDNNWVELIAESSGDTLTLVDLPRVSPDSTRFVVVAASYETCEGVARIDAWSLGAPRPALEFTAQTFDCTRNLGWWATDVAWRAPDSVSFVRRSLPADTAPGWLVRRAATWALDSASAAAIPRDSL